MHVNVSPHLYITDQSPGQCINVRWHCLTRLCTYLLSAAGAILNVV